MASSRSAVIDMIRGLSRSARRAVKGLVPSPRSRPGSVGSLLSMCPSRAAYIESGSGCQPRAFLRSRGSASAARASAYPVTSQAGVPPGMITAETGRCARSLACTEYGSWKYSVPRCSTVAWSMPVSLSNNLCVVKGVVCAGAFRLSRDGHQFHRPIRTTADGTSSVRTKKVSISTPSARPTPTSTMVLTFCVPALPEPTTASTPNVPASTSPAEVTVVPVTRSARLTASGSGTRCIVHPRINLGIAVDVAGKDGNRNLLVPNIKNAGALDFAQYVTTFDDLVDRAGQGKRAPADFQDTTISLTNPGTVGTMTSSPRLMTGQGA